MLSRILRNAQSFSFHLIESIIRNWSGAFGRRLRASYYRHRLGSCGSNLIIDVGVIFKNPTSVHVGSNVWIDSYTIINSGRSAGSRKIDSRTNPSYHHEIGEIHIKDSVHIAEFCVLQAHGGMSIGSNTSIAAGSKIFTLSHHYRNTLNEDDKNRYSPSTTAPFSDQFLICAPVVIGNAAMIGLNSVLLPGTTVPDNTWVGVQTFIKGTQLESARTYSGAPAELLPVSRSTCKPK